ncbi:hypothetical protein BGX27_006577 [Mortierella sp. AM989]|nr:hypothetical protein BGX27_006577 [Mortierella sp. AM989]
MGTNNRSQGAGSNSDMELSSGGDSIDVDTKNYQDNPRGDAMQRGIDFIGFESSGDELPDASYDYTPRSKNIDNKSKIGLDSRSSNSKKRTRSDLSDDSDGPSMGPPPGCPWMGHRKYSKMSSVSAMLTQELKDFVEYISPTREEHQIRKYVARRIEQMVKLVWRDAEVIVFGSFETKLYLPTSDMDIVVLRDPPFLKNDLYKLAGFLKSQNAAFDVVVIARAKVPIIKCKEAISGIAVDISFNMANGVQSAEVISRYLDEMPGLRSMTMLIKFFLMLKNHNEVYNGGLGSYTTVIMILSFLQMHPEIQMKRLNPEDNLGVLLIEFFELYGLCYNYQRVGLSVRDGGSYFDKYSRGMGPPNNGRFVELLLTCIDPNDPENDTAKGSYSLKKIREVFVGAYGTLTKAVQDRHRDLFPDSTSSRSSHFRFDDKNRVPADSDKKSSGLHKQPQVSLIKSVFSIPRSVSQHRQEVEDVFYNGAFQRMYGDPEGIRGLDRIEERDRIAAKVDGDLIVEEYDNHSKDGNQEELIIFKGKGEEAEKSLSPAELELSVFMEMGYTHSEKRDAPRIQKLYSGPVAAFKEAQFDRKRDIYDFALSTQELTHRVALNTLFRLVMKDGGREANEAERMQAFRDAQRCVKGRFDSTDRKKAKQLWAIKLEKSDIIDAVKNIPEVKEGKKSKNSSSNKGAIASASSSCVAMPPREVEFIPEVDSEDGEEGEYFEDLLKEGVKEYGDSEEEGSYKPTRATGHRDPSNVNASEGSIQLPQLVSIPPHYRRRNSSRNEQLSNGNLPTRE